MCRKNDFILNVLDVIFKLSLFELPSLHLTQWSLADFIVRFLRLDSEDFNMVSGERQDHSRTPDRDFRCFQPCEIFLSHLPIPACGKDKK